MFKWFKNDDNNRKEKGESEKSSGASEERDDAVQSEQEAENNKDKSESEENPKVSKSDENLEPTQNSEATEVVKRLLHDLEGSAVKRSEEKALSSEKDTKSLPDEHEENISSAKKTPSEDDQSIPEEDAGDTYFSIDDAVNEAGYGKFQKVLTFLVGLGWFADAFEIIILSILGDFLACEWKLYRWQNALLTSVVFIGMTFGAPTFGKIADHFGRKTSLAVSLLLLFIFGAASAFSPNILAMQVLRGLMGFALGGIAQGVTLCCEYYPAEDRGIAGFYLSYYWAIGTLVLILLTWLIMHVWKSWKVLLIVASLPALLVLATMKWYPESARFYLVSGQYEKAVKQLEQMIKMNGKEMPPGKLMNIQTQHMETRGSFSDLMRKEHRLTTLLFFYIWFALAFTYYGVTLISPIIITHGSLRVSGKELADVLGSNVSEGAGFMQTQVKCKHFSTMNYVDLLWTSAAEFPGLLFFTILVGYCERKTLLTVACVITGGLILLLLIKTKASVAMNIILFCSRALSVGLFQLTFIMTTEAFPTTLRAVGMGTGSAFARIGGAIVPFAAQFLLMENAVATICVLAAIVFLAGICATCLPLETKGMHMKDLTGRILSVLSSGRMETHEGRDKV